METPVERKESYFRAKEKVRQVQIFYMHLVGYIIIVVLLSYNLYILEEGQYKNFFFWLIISFLVSWSIFIIVHAWIVFRGRLFKKSWEERKIQEFMDKDKKRLQ